MKNTDWYKKDVEEILDFYYDELSEDQRLKHLMYWIQNYADLNIEWTDMMLDMGDFNKIPIEVIIQFANQLYKNKPEYYKENYEFIEYEILEYAFFKKDKNLIKERIEILKQNPVTGIDTVISDTFYQLIFNRYSDLAIDFSKAVWEPLIESDKLIGEPEYPFVLTIYMHKLEEQYELFKAGNTSKWDNFIKEVEEYGFKNDNKRIDCIYDSLSKKLNIEETCNSSSEKGYDMLIINIHFLIYMKENYNISFILSNLWFEIINSEKLFSEKRLNFLIPFRKLENHIDRKYDNFLGNNQVEIFGKLWGLHYFYEFLNVNGLLNNEDYKLMCKNIAYLKNEFATAFCNDLWKLNFVFSWPRSKDNIQNFYSKDIFNKTYDLEYNECKAFIDSLK